MKRSLLGGCVVLLMLAGVSLAQSDRITLFAGYSHINSDFSLTSPNGLTGWNAEATFRVAGPISFVTDFAGYYPGYTFDCVGCGQHAKVHTFLFGPEASIRIGKFTPFARFLVGAGNDRFHSDGTSGFQYFSSNNTVMYGAGGGVDYRLTRLFALRAQADWLHNGYSTSDNQLTDREVHNVARISTGIVVRF